MEQTHDILKNRFFTGSTTSSVQSDLQYVNNYYLNESGQQDKIVDFSNIRSFLSNENNQKVVKAYYSFLSSSSIMNYALMLNPLSNDFIPTAQFKAIYYDDEKLADSFNNFYNTSILRGINSEYSVNPDVFNNAVRNQLMDGSGYEYITQNIFHNYYFWSSMTPSIAAYSPAKAPFTAATLDIYRGERNNNTEERYVDVPTKGEYYFINVLLMKRFTQTARMAFDACENVIYKTINSGVIFSQNPADLITNYDFLKTATQTNIKSVDSSFVKVIGSDTTPSTPTSTTLSAATPSLIQCFIDPNFVTNENTYWSDTHFNAIAINFNVSHLLTGDTIDVALPDVIIGEM